MGVVRGSIPRESNFLFLNTFCLKQKVVIAREVKWVEAKFFYGRLLLQKSIIDRDFNTLYKSWPQKAELK